MLQDNNEKRILVTYPRPTSNQKSAATATAPERPSLRRSNQPLSPLKCFPPDPGHLPVPLISRMSLIICIDIARLYDTRHISKDNLLLRNRPLMNNAAEFLVEFVDPRLRCRVQIGEKGGKDDGRAWDVMEEFVEKVVHIGARAGGVAGGFPSTGIVGADVNED